MNATEEDRQHRRYLARTRAIREQAHALNRIAEQLETANMIAVGIKYQWTVENGLNGLWSRVLRRLGQ